jgi:hypothetical protein
VEHRKEQRAQEAKLLDEVGSSRFQRQDRTET